MTTFLKVFWSFVTVVGVLALIGVGLIVVVIVSGGYHEGVAEGPFGGVISVVMIVTFMDPAIAALFWYGLASTVFGFINVRRLFSKRAPGA